MRQIAYFIDMDGVMAKWGEDEFEDTFLPDYFLNRPPEETAINMVKQLRDHGEKVFILSAAYTETNARAEKKEWLRKYGLGDIPVIFSECGYNKADYVPVDDNTDYVLVDDYTKNLDMWEKSGHIGVKFLNGINGSFGNWTGYTVSYRSDGEHLYVALKSIAEAEQRRRQ